MATCNPRRQKKAQEAAQKRRVQEIEMGLVLLP
jgi:hypothetical protein